MCLAVGNTSTSDDEEQSSDDDDDSTKEVESKYTPIGVFCGVPL